MLKIHCLASQILHMKPFFFLELPLKVLWFFRSSAGIIGVLRRMLGWCNVVRCKNVSTVADFAPNHKTYITLIENAAILLSLPDETPPFVSREAHHVGAFVISVHCSSYRKMSPVRVGVRRTRHEVKSSLAAQDVRP